MKRIALLGVVASLFACMPAWGASIVVGAPSTSSNAFPFGDEINNPGTRYQQAYSAADFAGLGAISIDSIDFLGGKGGTLAASTYSLSFSTISAGIDTLSNTNFDSNLGANNALFTSVALSGPPPATLTFVGIPFLYNPASGNLLLDIIVSPGGVPVTGSPASYQSRSNATGIFSRYHNFGAGNIGFGLVTQFDYTPAAATVPEPSSLILSVVGIVVVAIARARVRT